MTLVATAYRRPCAWVVISRRRRMQKRTSYGRSMFGRSVGHRPLVACVVSLAVALGASGVALADDLPGALADPGATTQPAALPALSTSAATATTSADTPAAPTGAAPPATTVDRVANTAPTSPIPAPVSAENVVSTPLSTLATVAPPAPASNVPTPPAPLPTPDPAPAATGSTAPVPAGTASGSAPTQVVPTPIPAPPPSTPAGAPTAPSTPAPAAPVSQLPPQYQNANSSDTNSLPNNAQISGGQIQSNPELIPSLGGSMLVWNWDWNDVVNCSFCNVSISVRVLSPGDDGDLAQTNVITSTSVSSVIDSLQQALAQQPVAPTPVALPAPPLVTPPIRAGGASPRGCPRADPSERAEARADPGARGLAGGPPETAAPSDDATDPGAVTPAPPTVVTQPMFTADTSVVPAAGGPRRARPHRPAVASHVAKDRVRKIVTAFAPPTAVAPAVAPSESRAAVPEVETAAAVPKDGGDRIPRHAPPPPRLPPLDEPYVGSAVGAHGSGPPAGSPTSFLALLVFLAPGFAQWLWAMAALRPGALRPRRPERPG